MVVALVVSDEALLALHDMFGPRRLIGLPQPSSFHCKTPRRISSPLFHAAPRNGLAVGRIR